MTMTWSMCCLARSSCDGGAVVAGDAGLADPAPGAFAPVGSPAECAQAAASAKHARREATDCFGGFISCPRDRRRAGRRMGVQDQRRERLLGEVELVPQVAQLVHVLPHGWPGVWAAVGLGVEPLTTQEQILDELEVRVEG